MGDRWADVSGHPRKDWPELLARPATQRAIDRRQRLNVLAPAMGRREYTRRNGHQLGLRLKAAVTGLKRIFVSINQALQRIWGVGVLGDTGRKRLNHVVLANRPAYPDFFHSVTPPLETDRAEGRLADDEAHACQLDIQRIQRQQASAIFEGRVARRDPSIFVSPCEAGIKAVPIFPARWAGR